MDSCVPRRGRGFDVAVADYSKPHPIIRSQLMGGQRSPGTGHLLLRLGPGKRTAVDVSAYFWHFLDAIWIYLMALFFFWG